MFAIELGSFKYYAKHQLKTFLKCFNNIFQNAFFHIKCKYYKKKKNRFQMMFLNNIFN